MADLLYLDVVERFVGEQFNEAFAFSGIVPESTSVHTAVATVTKSDGTDLTDTVLIAQSISSTTVTLTLKMPSTECSLVVKVAVVASDLTPTVRAKLFNVSSLGAFV